MPSWQSVKPQQPHSNTGTCWCGYVTGQIGKQDKAVKPSGVFSGVRHA